MTKFLLSIILIAICFFAKAQNIANFNSIGKQVKVHTLSNGKFDESFVNDTLQQIGSVEMDVTTGHIKKLLPTSNIGSAEEDMIVGTTFLSVDPLTAKFAMYSPYQFAGNKPIWATDVDGLEEYLYFLALDKKGKTQITLSDTRTVEEHSTLWGLITWKTKIPERYTVVFQNEIYKIGYSPSEGGAGNERKEGLFKFLLKVPNFDARIVPQLFYTEDESSKNALTHTLDYVKEAAFAALLGDFAPLRSINYKGFSKGKLEEHFTKHGSEFPGETQSGYLKRAKEFAAETGEHIQEELVGNFYVKYDKSTRRTLIGNVKDREIRTFYRADDRSANPFEDAVKLAGELSKPK